MNSLIFILFSSFNFSLLRLNSLKISLILLWFFSCFFCFYFWFNFYAPLKNMKIFSSNLIKTFSQNFLENEIRSENWNILCWGLRVSKTSSFYFFTNSCLHFFAPACQVFYVCSPKKFPQKLNIHSTKRIVSQ